MRRWAVVFSLGASALIFFTLNFSALLVKHSPIECKNILPAGVSLKGSFDCELRGIFRRMPFVVSESLRDSPVGNEIFVANSSDVAKRVSFYFQSDGRAAFYVFDGSPQPKETSFIDVSNLSGRNPGRLEITLPPKHLGVVVKLLGGRSQMLFGDIQEISDPAATEFTIRKEKTSQYSSWIFWTLVISVMVSLGFLLKNFGFNNHRSCFFAGCVCFFIATLFYGTPYISNAGFYDTFDDTSYLDWAHAIGYKLNWDITSNDFASPAQKNNVHSFGTGLLLAPAMTLTRIFFPQGNGFNDMGFTLVSLNSTLLTFLSLIFYYLAFCTFASKPIALFSSFLTLATTSLIKWTYVRNFFSHSAEAFALAVMMYFFAKIYIARQPRKLFYWGFLIFGILLIQIRKENALLLLAPIFYEFAGSGALKVKFKHAMMFVLGVVVATLIGFATNKLTELNVFWYVPTASLIQLDAFWEMIQKNAINVVFGNEFGFFSWWNFSAWLALVSMYFFRHRIHLLIPPIGLVLAYLLMCTLHVFPNGVEWQNRFLLKLNPIIFSGAAFLLAQLYLRRRIFLLSSVVSLLIVNILYQYHLYKQNFPAFAPLYRDFLSDYAILFPTPFADSSLFYFFPLVVFNLLAIGAFASLKRGGWVNKK